MEEEGARPSVRQAEGKAAALVGPNPQEPPVGWGCHGVFLPRHTKQQHRLVSMEDPIL